MKHLGFVGKSTEHLGYTHVEIINSSLRLSFNVPLKNNPEEVFRKMVESNYDLLMATSSEISFELDHEIIENLEKLTLYTTNFTEPLSYQDSAFLKLPKFP